MKTAYLILLLIGFGLSTQSGQAGLIGHWKFDEGSGTTTADATTNANNGTLVSSPTWVTNGVSSNALSFTTSQYVTVPHWSGFNLTNALSISVWVKPSQAGQGGPGYSQFFTKWDSYFGDWGLRFTDGTNLVFQMTGMNGNSLGSAAKLSTNQWTHVVATYDGSLGKLYVNGKLDRFAAWSGAHVATTNALKIGVLPGVIDEARVYDQALTASEVSNLFTAQDTDGDRLVDANEVLAGSNTSDPDSDDDEFTDGEEVFAGTDPLNAASHPDITTALAGWWRLDETNGTTAVDITLNNSNGTLNNGPVWTSGIISNGLSFDGVNDYVMCGVGGEGSPLAVSNLTVAMWVCVTNVNQNSDPLHRQAGSGPTEGGYRVTWSSTYNVVGLAIPGRAVDNSLANILTNTWHHLLYTYDGTQMVAYLDGVQRSTSSTTNAVKSSTEPLYLGQATWFSGRYLGKLDDVRIYNRALSAGDVFVLAGKADYSSTDTDLFDTDSDQLPDGWELANGLNPNSASGNDGTFGDLDGDGYTNMQEYNFSTNPNSAGSYPAGLPANLAAWWRLDEGTSTNAFDSSGNINTGFLKNGSTWVSSAYTNAVNFDGNDDYIEALTSASLDYTNALTVMTWVKATNTTDKALISYRCQEYNSGWRLFFSTGKAILQWATPGTFRSLTAYGTFPSNVWHHVAAVYEPNAAKLYVNGALLAIYSNAGSNLVLTSSNKLTLGKTLGGSAYAFPGQLDDVRIYNRALNATEITAIADADQDRLNNVREIQAGTDQENPDTDADGYTDLQEVNLSTDPLSTTNAPAIPQGLLGWWKLDEGTGTFTSDASAYDQPGTLKNGLSWTNGVFQSATRGSNSQYVAVNPWPDHSPTNAMTASVWIKPEGIGATSPSFTRFFHKGGYFGGWALYYGADQKVLFQLTGQNGNSLWSTATAPTGQWNHVVATVSNNAAKLYINGVLNVTNNFTGQKLVSYDELWISFYDASTQKFARLDDARLYNRALSTNEIAAIYDMDTDGDGVSNVNEINRDNTDPNDSNSHVSASITIPNAWATYLATNLVEITADTRATGTGTTVKSAEYFHNAPGANGAGNAMSALDVTFNSSNETATATFNPGFPATERHELYVHARANNGAWSDFVKIILNPNVNDILEKMKTNYAAIVDQTYDAEMSLYIEEELQQSALTYHIQQKGGYRYRQTDPATDEVVIANHSELAYLNSLGQYDGGYELGTIGNLQSGMAETNAPAYYWDVDAFLAEHPNTTTNSVTASIDGTVTFEAVPANTNVYSKVTITVDFGRGLPVREVYLMPDGTTAEISHQSPVLLNSTVWLPTYETVTINLSDDNTLEWHQSITDLQINTGLADSLFDIPSP